MTTEPRELAPPMAVTESTWAIIEDLQREIIAGGWRELELRWRLAAAGLDAAPPRGQMTMERVQALENACDAAREALRPDTTEAERSEAIRLCDLARRTG